MSNPPVEPLAVVLGKSCKRIRTNAKVTQNVLAKHARSAGLRWTASKVGDFEAGRTAPTLATALAVTAALSWATESDITLIDLVDCTGFVSLTDQLDLSSTALQDVIRGARPWRAILVEDTSRAGGGGKQIAFDLSGLPARYGNAPIREIEQVEKRSGIDEERLAKRLQIGRLHLSAASWKLWGRSFSDERDERAGETANAQRRGQVSRNLQTELREELARGDDK